MHGPTVLPDALVRIHASTRCRVSSRFDLDLDAAPKNASQFNSGDGLHPNVAGDEAIADAFDLGVFSNASYAVHNSGSTMSLPNERVLSLIEELHAAVTGMSSSMFHKHNDKPITIDCLDLTPHLQAVKALWLTVEPQILICQEYGDALAFIETESSDAAPAQMGG
ncbi:hypothetical protein PHLGIDRAFT_120288 [Phlebiopsis gigantea 11061_1 CR5-6]|uniref:Uncharacterized protein n=1 Tax=Phlebiopsis gigantea (strain 11061_1 CR5-6) TaxID=745531 RepID=A0A0C3RUX7_PHLG1|nr:hypothetical protein PHLGIDRAFT_120288 [Phlebiopsis gigantea 11061_1 CR5-6]